MVGILLDGQIYRPEILHSSSETLLAVSRGGSEHAHPVYHIVLYNHGVGAVRIGGERSVTEKGDLFFISPMQMHQFIPHPKQAHTYHEITFGLYDSAERPCSLPFPAIFKGLGLPSVPSHVHLPDGQFRLLFSAIAPFVRLGYNPPGHENDRTRLALALLSFLRESGELLSGGRRPFANASGNDPAMEKVADYMNENYQGKIALEPLARLAGCSREHLCRKFRKSFNRSVIEYLTALRLELAEKMLRTSGLPVKEICARVGIEDIYYFSKVFKRRYGLPPRKYLKRIPWAR
ncbi:MAG: AraC family transcriptional regulator [Fibrobacterota bacterium]